MFLFRISPAPYNLGQPRMSVQLQFQLSVLTVGYTLCRLLLVVSHLAVM